MVRSICDCDCVIFYFDRPGDIFPWNSNWMHSEHINGRIASIFSRRLDVSNASCSQFQVNLMHTSRTHEVPGVHEFTTPGIYLTSHLGTALSYATPTRLACDQLNSDYFRFAYCGTIGSKREAVFDQSQSSTTNCRPSVKQCCWCNSGVKEAPMSELFLLMFQILVSSSEFTMPFRIGKKQKTWKRRPTGDFQSRRPGN